MLGISEILWIDSLCLGGKVSIRKDLSKYPRMKFLMVLGLTLCLDFALSDPLRLQVEVLAKPEMEMEGDRVRKDVIFHPMIFQKFQFFLRL